MKTKYSSSLLTLLTALFVACACLLLLKERHPHRAAPVQIFKPKFNLIMDPVLRYAPLQSGAFFI